MHDPLRVRIAGSPKLPPIHDWRTTDTDEINRRRLRAQVENLKITNLDSAHVIFSSYQVQSASGRTYRVEIRDLTKRQNVCDCVDFRINGLGTCKHIEAVLMYLERRHRRLYREAMAKGSDRLDIVPDLAADTLRLQGGRRGVPVVLREWFNADGRLQGAEPELALEHLGRLRLPSLRISQEVAPWLQARQQAAERKALRRDYEQKVQRGEWPAQETRVALYPYQREGMLHLAFTERALLADEMGLGKTIQAVAACALLQRLGQAQKVLVVTPASLKTEWEEQIQKFTVLPYQLVYGQRSKRLQAYANAPFFTLVNYEQMLTDSLDVNARLRPEVIILDEAQRIKNWNTKTAQAVKRLRSRYAFVLTGTPIENRIDELHSLMDFLNPSVLGPLFRFNRDFYVLDDRGRPSGYQNLDRLRERIRPWMLRRRKVDVETELPPRTERTYFVPLSPEQRNNYQDHEAQVARLLHLAKRRPLTQQEQEKLQRELAMMRMVCDTNYILDPKDQICPKLGELGKILEECRDNPEVKVIVFSEWERMLQLVRGLCDRLGLGHAWHTGSVPQRRRRAEINLFKQNPDCRVFLSTDSGSTGLNLQNASMVVNCDLPWNPARLEQRIARAWRKHQTRPVTVIHLVSESTIEHRMIGTLASKKALADGVLDNVGDLKTIKLAGGRQAFLARLEQLMAPVTSSSKPLSPPPAKPLPVDRALGFAQRAGDLLQSALVRCEEQYPQQGAHSVLLVVVDGDAPLWQAKLAPIHEEFFGPGKSDPLCPVQLAVIDRSADEALRRLMEAGLVGKASRAIRLLHPTTAGDQPRLSDADREKARALRAQAARKLKAGQLLGAGGLLEEARHAVSETILFLGQALSVEQHLPEPATLEAVNQAPWQILWGDKLPQIQLFLKDGTHPWEPLAAELQARLEAGVAASMPSILGQ